MQLYDCYTITVLLTIEDSGFCGKGEGMAFVREHDLRSTATSRSTPTAASSASARPGLAGGMSHVTEAVRQVRGAAGGRQVRRCDTAYVLGTGGIMTEQTALIVRGG